MQKVKSTFNRMIWEGGQDGAENASKFFSVAILDISEISSLNCVELLHFVAPVLVLWHGTNSSASAAAALSRGDMQLDIQYDFSQFLVASSTNAIEKKNTV